MATTIRKLPNISIKDLSLLLTEQPTETHYKMPRGSGRTADDDGGRNGRNANPYDIAPRIATSTAIKRHYETSSNTFVMWVVDGLYWALAKWALVSTPTSSIE